MVRRGNRSVRRVGNDNLGVLRLLGYGWKLGYLSLRLVEEGLECLYGLENGKRLWLWSWWSIACGGEENQPGLAAISGGTMEEDKVL